MANLTDECVWVPLEIWGVPNICPEYFCPEPVSALQYGSLTQLPSRPGLVLSLHLRGAFSLGQAIWGGGGLHARVFGKWFPAVACAPAFVPWNGCLDAWAGAGCAALAGGGAVVLTATQDS